MRTEMAVFVFAVQPPCLLQSHGQILGGPINH